MVEFTCDYLRVRVYSTRSLLAAQAVYDIEQTVTELLQRRECVTMVFAAAPSQQEVLSGLRESRSIDWSRIIALHMDEYIGLPEGATESFGCFLEDNLFSRVPLRAVHYFDYQAVDITQECCRYTDILRKNKPDITLLGVGENGHLAFNDPGTADFSDSELVKTVELEMACRQQQVNDSCFARLEEVPRYAYTLTIPALLLAERLFCVVPGARKALAVKHMLQGEIAESCPASVLRKVSGAELYLDSESAGEVL